MHMAKSSIIAHASGHPEMKLPGPRQLPIDAFLPLRARGPNRLGTIKAFAASQHTVMLDAISTQVECFPSRWRSTGLLKLDACAQAA